MKTQSVTDLVTAVRDLYGSDSKAAPHLNVSQNTFTEWRNGTAYPTDDNARRIAELLKLDAAYVLAVIHGARAKSKETRDIWRRMAEQFAKAASVAIIAAAPFMAPPESRAAAFNINDVNTHCRRKQRRGWTMALP